MFYFNQILYNLSNQLLRISFKQDIKELKLIICTFIKKNPFKKWFIWKKITFHSDMKTCDTKRQVTIQKSKMI